VLNKVDAATEEGAQAAVETLGVINPTAPVVQASSPVRLESTEAVKGRRVLVIEDGPTITHSGMPFGAGYVAATAADAGEIVDPRTSAGPPIREVFTAYQHIGRSLRRKLQYRGAVGYGAAQLQALENAINASDAEVVVSATPVDLARVLHITKPVVARPLRIRRSRRAQPIGGPFRFSRSRHREVRLNLIAQPVRDLRPAAFDRVHSQIR
jgi:predicted GTPase